MAWNRLRFARTTEALRAVTTYMRGEPIMPTDGASADKLFVGDGSTVGGNRLLMAEEIGGVWLALTPSVISSGGTLTSATGAVRYRQVGKLVFGTATATIATNGTGSSAVDIATASLPPVSTALSPIAPAGGFESGLTNKTLSVALFTFSGTTTFRCRFADGTYPGANGARMSVGFIYEAA